MNKLQLVNIANETLQILKAGSYRFDRNTNVNFSEDLAACIKNTKLYKPDSNITFNKKSEDTIIVVTNQTTLAAGKELVDKGYYNVTCLNFASAKHPGGGFLKGSRAQEESLVRSSGLYASINQNAMKEMYLYNQNLNGLYSDYSIYSPDVPVFRDDDYRLLNKYYKLSFVTSPAVNLNALDDYHKAYNTMFNRIDKILNICSENNSDALVLGAFGCGVFRNDPKDVADCFKKLLKTKYKGCFKEIIFAIKTNDNSLINTFSNILALV